MYNKSGPLDQTSPRDLWPWLNGKVGLAGQTNVHLAQHSREQIHSLLQGLHSSCRRRIILELHKADGRTSFRVDLGFDKTLTPAVGRKGRGGEECVGSVCVCVCVCVCVHPITHCLKSSTSSSSVWCGSRLATNSVEHGKATSPF